MIPMTVHVKIKKGDSGTTYEFTIEDVNLSNVEGYTAKIYIWKGTTKLVDGGTCSSAFSDPDTIVTYVTTTAASATVGIWNAEIEFTKTGYEETTKTFEWEVEESSPEA